MTLLPLKERTRGGDIFNEFKLYVRDNKNNISKLIAIATDGMLAMIGMHVEFVALYRKDPDIPLFVS